MHAHKSILAIDDNILYGRFFAGQLADCARYAELKVHICQTEAQARDYLADQCVSWLFIDFCLAEGHSMDFVRWVKSAQRAGRVYCMTGLLTPARQAASMAAGCDGIFEKPLEPTLLIELLEQEQIEDLSIEGWRKEFAPEILGRNPQLLKQLEIIRRVADADSTVLISGETGTGKELAARALHQASLRRNAPFVALNCAALPDGLIEDELFGHTKGAFTGAAGARSGRILSAQGGTLFLDEICEMPLLAQAKLLRVLQERKLTPVGSDETIPFDTRIVAATNRDISSMVDQKLFREDLFYRLITVRVHLPALRERHEDILPLAYHFVNLANIKYERCVEGLEPAAEVLLLEHSWPGNVRCLASVMESSVLLRRAGVIKRAELATTFPRPPKVQTAESPGILFPPTEPDPSTDLNLRDALDRVERGFIQAALVRSAGNRTEAAALLGLNRTTLVEKLRKHPA